MKACPFCEIIAGRAPADVIQVGPGAAVIVIRPLNPVVDGHLLVIPSRHVRDAAEDPDVAAETMRWAAVVAGAYGGDAYNLITSAGAAATQSIHHLHIHLVPRAFDDGLALPWHTGYGQHEYADRAGA